MISPYEIVLRLLLGAFFGGAIGYERQVHGRPAGLRTNLIVCVASVLLMMTSEYYQHLSVMNPDFVRVDPGRIAAGAITGIGFLGAGVVLKLGATIQGLTTAASIWMVSAIGLAIGGGLYLASTVSFGLTVFALIVLRALERNISTVAFRNVEIVSDGGTGEEEISDALTGHGASIRKIDYEKDVATGRIKYHITVSIVDRVSLKGILDALSALKGVKKVVIKS